DPLGPGKAKVRLRAHGPEIPCRVVPLGPQGTHEGTPARRRGARIRLELDEPVDAVAPGQAGVLYDGDLVLGGGTVTTTGLGTDIPTR
ncbi:MAG TPA: aminomethyltransferase beta-barrel domain-containing protein, partial [Actinomycetota bacterium]|nr:aminomethyltransferase beta-barrel domain-containing protein [Actinomycetota bacterium]